MLNALIALALRHRGIVLGLSLLLAVQGILALQRVRLDVFPDFGAPLALVHTEAPGLSSEQVELQVTQPIENALAGTAGVKSMRSKSLQGLSVVTLSFEDAADPLRARQQVGERLATAQAALPAGVAAPALLPATSAAGTVLIAGLRSPGGDLLVLHDAAQWTLRPQLLSVPGVAEVVVFGGETRQLQVRVDPARLRLHGLALGEVLAAVRSASGVRGAGFIDDGQQRIALRTEGQAASPAALAGTVLRWHDGAALRLQDVAQVGYGPAPAVGAAALQGEPAVLLIVESQPGADTLRLTRALESRLDALAPALARQGMVLQPDVFRPASFIERATGHLGWMILLAALLVVLVLFLFLLEARAALISVLAIPLSLLAAIAVLEALGVSLNTMSLAGLAIAIGEVVDDAIVDVENIHRRLRANQALPAPAPAMLVVLRASLEVRSAVVCATLAVILVFVPLLTLSGVAGKLFAPLAQAYILAVLASLLVALTLTPALSLALLGGAPAGSDDRAEPRWLARMRVRYLALLARAETRSRGVLVGAGVLCLLALALPFMLERSFIPELHEGHYIAHLGLAPGTSLDESMRTGALLARQLLRVPGVRSVAQSAGRAAEVVDPAGVQLSELEIGLAPLDAAGQDAALRAIRATLARMPGVTASVNSFLAERIDESISGSTAPVLVQVSGDSLDLVERATQDIARWLGTLPGAAEVRVESSASMPEWSVRLRMDALARWGLRPVEVLDAVQTAFAGSVAGQVHQGNRAIDISVMLAPSARARIGAVGELLLHNPDGLGVPLRELADIREVRGRYQVAHTDGQRVQSIALRPGSRGAEDLVREARARLPREVRLPPGVRVVFAGEAEAQARAQRDLMLHGAMALGGIALVVALALRSRRAVLLVLAGLPFALVGGALAAALGGRLALGGMVGFVTLFGIALRNTIMLVSHFQQLVDDEGLPWDRATMLRGAGERLVPILMTALVTALALLPLAWTSGAPGNEVEGPMAAVILGGLLSSTVLSLLVLPLLALRFGRFGRLARV